MQAHPTTRKSAGLLALAGALGALAVAAPAGATVPGANGRIFFDTNRDGNYEIYSVGGDGQTNVTNSPSYDADPAVSPDGQKVLFVSNRGGQTDLWTMNADGSSPEQVTDTAEAERQPAWSPDGTQIAYVAPHDGVDRIFVASSDGSSPRVLVRRRLVNPEVIGDLGGLVTERALQSAALKPIDDQLPDEPLDPPDPPPPPPPPEPKKIMETDPAWSPDGKRIAFASKLDGEDGDTYELWVVNASGFGLRQLTKNDRSDRYPAFSPDGAKLAHTYGRNNLPRQEIWVLQVDDTASRTKVTDGEGLVFLHTRPAFSPDGLNIVYVRDSVLHVVAAAGGPSVPLTQATPNVLDSNPDWQALGFVLPPQPQPPAGDPGTGQPGAGATGQAGGGATGQPGAGQPDGPGTGTPSAKGCTIVGTTGDDVLVGTKGADVICGLAGDDVLRGKGGNDVIKGGAGDDRLLGGGGRDVLRAGAGDDELRGGGGADRLYGQAGDDTFFASKAGRDLLVGGPGRDDAVFDRARDLLRGIETAL